MPLGESVLDNALEALRSCSSDISLIGNLFFSARNCGIVNVLLKRYTRIVAVVKELRFNGFIVTKDGVGRVAGIVPFEGQSCVAETRLEV